MIFHCFYIELWRDWSHPMSPAPRADGRRQAKRVQPDWLEYRYRFMVDQTLASLANQSFVSPVYIFVEPHYRAEIDKIAQSKPLPEFCEIISEPIRDLLVARHDFDVLYLSRIDSDDLYHQTVVEEIISQEPTAECFVYRSGYVYDIPTRKLAPYKHPSPPFYTDVYTREELEAVASKRRSSHSHTHMVKTRELTTGKFVVLCHRSEMQCTTNYNTLAQVSRGIKSISISNPPFIRADDLREFGCPHLSLIQTVHSEQSSDTPNST